MNKKILLNGVFAVVAPFVVLTIFLVFSRWPQRTFTDLSDQIAFVSSAVAGCVFLLYLPINKWVRTVAVVIYIPLITSAMFLYALYFVCYVFGDCI